MTQICLFPFGGISFRVLQMWGQERGLGWPFLFSQTPLFAIWPRMSKTVSHCVTCRLQLTVTSARQEFSKNVSYGEVAPRWVHYKQKYVAIFSIFCSVICNKRDPLICRAATHQWIVAYNVIARRPYSSYRSRFCHTQPAFDAAINSSSFELSR